MNITGLTGNLTRDPELRFLPDGTPVGNIRIAVSGAGPHGEAGYVNVEEFGPGGRAAAEHLRKGSQVEVSGKLKWSEWTHPETGRHVERVWIRGHIGFLGQRPDAEQIPDDDGPFELPPPSDSYTHDLTDDPLLVADAPQSALLADGPPAASALLHGTDDIPA
jgi:single-strand DNA-binding protein